MMLTHAARGAMRYRDPQCEALLRQLGRGCSIPQPVLLGLTGLPRAALATAARELAGRLGRSLLRADLGGGLNRWIGETEKNLDVLFNRAQSGDAVLLFDEADALFGKRSQPSASHDRRAKQETSHLLARLERLRGVAIVLFDSEQQAQQRRGRLQPWVLRYPPA